MLDGAWGGSFRRNRNGHHSGLHKPPRAGRCLQLESLEGRQLLAASIATISPLTVPAGQGYQVPIDGSASGATKQTFTVTSSKPNLKSVTAKGPSARPMNSAGRL